jgi:hypothetical protein
LYKCTRHWINFDLLIRTICKDSRSIRPESVLGFGSKIVEKLPQNIRDTDEIAVFKAALKEHYCKKAY